ncbi:MAG TPA: hypothetical protein VMR44_03115, partial [Thermoanaerobaculia bacterium]|nr:hypothetical protein [Thermoanaerobaculia bacterium]
MTSPVRDDPRRRIPPVDRVLDDPILEHLQGVYGREAVRVQARRVLEELRDGLAQGALEAPAGDAAEASADALAALV